MADININLENTNPLELLGQGIRAFSMRDYNAAVAAFSKASEITVKEHDDPKHDSLGNIYLYYGKALLELSREEAEALGDALPHALDNSDNEDEEDEEETNQTNKIEEKSNETKNSQEGNSAAQEENITKGAQNENEKTEDVAKSDSKSQNGESGKKEDSEQEETTENGLEKNGTEETAVKEIEEPQPSSSTENCEKAVENDEDASDLQVAWEVLELAKLIFEKRGEAGKKDLADTLITLGEVSLESENFESAINDIKHGLEIQKTIYKDDSRQLAETYYKLGMALSTNNQMDEAIESLNLSLGILNNKVEKLKQVDDAEAAKNEIKEIESLMPEIEEKIADMKSFKEEAVKKISESIELQTNKFEGSTSKGQANDISHLVKRKRKIEDITEELENNPSKKMSPEAKE